VGTEPVSPRQSAPTLWHGASQLQRRGRVRRGRSIRSHDCATPSVLLETDRRTPLGREKLGGPVFGNVTRPDRAYAALGYHL
jgi:hypothetical protein